jgi:hypothetical protein
MGQSNNDPIATIEKGNSPPHRKQLDTCLIETVRAHEEPGATDGLVDKGPQTTYFRADGPTKWIVGGETANPLSPGTVGAYSIAIADKKSGGLVAYGTPVDPQDHHPLTSGVMVAQKGNLPAKTVQEAKQMLGEVKVCMEKKFQPPGP